MKLRSAHIQIRIARQYNHLDTWTICIDKPGHVNAVLTWHFDVGDNDIRWTIFI